MPHIFQNSSSDYAEVSVLHIHQKVLHLLLVQTTFTLQTRETHKQQDVHLSILSKFTYSVLTITLFITKAFYTKFFFN